MRGAVQFPIAVKPICKQRMILNQWPEQIVKGIISKNIEIDNHLTNYN